MYIKIHIRVCTTYMYTCTCIYTRQCTTVPVYMYTTTVSYCIHVHVLYIDNLQSGLHRVYTRLCVHVFPCLPYVFPCLPYLAYITLDLNPASWAALVAQLAEHWTSNPVVTGSNPVRGSSVFFFTVCLRTMPYLVLPSFAYTCTRFDHVHVSAGSDM